MKKKLNDNHVYKANHNFVKDDLSGNNNAEYNGIHSDDW